MCCDDEEVLGLPPAVIEMLARYRRLQAEQGYGWGETELPDLFRWSRFSLLGPAFDELAASGDWAAAVDAAVGDGDPPCGVVVVRLDGDSVAEVAAGPPRPTVAGTVVAVDVLVRAAADRPGAVRVAGEVIEVAAGGLELRVVDCAAEHVTVGDHDVPVTSARPAGRLRLRAPACARWSVTDETGGAWFPSGVPRKWDVNHRPFFHAGTAELDVPTGPLHVTAARGLEFERAEWDVDAASGATAEVVWEPRRRFDPAAEGWYGGDLHVHLNYSGDHVLEPVDAARMQHGEGLHVMNLTAGNLGGTLVYDRELLEATAGRQLWSGAAAAVAGLEFRNDLLGHVHGFGLAGVPERLHSGHEGTDQPHDWPPNSDACARMRALGAVTTYAHPAWTSLDDVDALFAPVRSVEARELVADAALGLVDAVEVVSCADDRGAVVLWHHLLNCGLRLAATAGTDTFLSFAHGPGIASNPPGWGRVYARLDGAALTVAAFRDAVRAGRTTVTNGPWVTFDVAGAGPGAVLDRRPGDRLRVRARTVGGGVDRLVLHGPDGELATTAADELHREITVDGPLWLAAAAYGGDDPHTLGAPVFAHTSPVYVDVDGRRVARAASARWCLTALDGLERLVHEHGRFDPEHREEQLGDLMAVITQARSVYRPQAADRRS
jgi:hypothetical protein